MDPSSSGQNDNNTTDISSEENAKFTREHKRGPNWTIDEDKQLCYSWVNALEDPYNKNIDPERNQLWQRITDDFQKHMPTSSRSEKSVTSRWCQINSKVAVFWEYVSELTSLQRKGDTEAKIHKEARELYRLGDKKMKAFKLEHCYEILKDTRVWYDEFILPKKAKEVVKEVEEDSNDTTSNDVIVEVVRGHKRSNPFEKEKEKRTMSDLIEMLRETMNKRLKHLGEQTKLEQLQSDVKLLMINLNTIEDPECHKAVKFYQNEALARVRAQQDDRIRQPSEKND